MAKQQNKENNTMYDFDEGNNSGGNSEGPWLNFHAREKLDGSMPSRSFSLRTEDGLENVTEKMKKGVAFDLEQGFRTGWCFSNGQPGVAPEWVWNTTPARFDQAQPADRGEDRWKKGFSIRLALGKDNAATWTQSGAGAWAGLVSLMKAVKADGGSGETVVAVLSSIEDIKFAKGGTSAPQFTVKKWADRPDCLKEQAAPVVEGDEEF
tara:strand:- start:339 stop:962 length:624 start_codon:yes stop_codon:yes gene_type:complete